MVRTPSQTVLDRQRLRPSPVRMLAPLRRLGRSRWSPRALGVLALLVLALALLPGAPGPEHDLAAAATARAALRYDRALQFYARAEALAPADARAYCGAGEVHMLRQEVAAAIADFSACVRRAPSRGSAWLSLGDAQAQSDPTAASAAWQRAASAGDPLGHARLGALYERQQRFDLAGREWAAMPYGTPLAAVHLGLIALWNGDVAAARTAFVAARRTPNAVGTQAEQQGFVLYAAQPLTGAAGGERLGYLYLAAGMPYFAVRPLQTALAADAARGIAHSYLGWAFWLLGQRTAARTEIARGLAQAPDRSFAWYTAAEVDVAGGNTVRAAERIQHALALDARNPVLWAAAADLAMTTRDYATAELSLDSAMQVSNDSAYAVALLRFYADTSLGISTGRALIATTTAISRWPASAEVRYQAGRVFLMLRQPANAYYNLIAARALDPTAPAPYVLLARMAIDAGNYVAGALALRTALALAPTGPEAATARSLLAPIAHVTV